MRKSSTIAAFVGILTSCSSQNYFPCSSKSFGDDNSWLTVQSLSQFHMTPPLVHAHICFMHTLTCKHRVSFKTLQDNPENLPRPMVSQNTHSKWAGDPCRVVCPSCVVCTPKREGDEHGYLTEAVFENVTFLGCMFSVLSPWVNMSWSLLA